MIQSYFNVKNIDGSYWTLVIELTFYLFILTVYLMKGLNKIEIVGYCVVSACWINQLFFKAHALIIYNLLSNYLPIINYFPLFIAGIVFYRIKFDKITFLKAILLVFCFTTQAFVTEQTERLYIAEITRLQYVTIVFSFFMIFLLYCYGYLHFIVNRVALFLGKISYSLYLIHQYIAYNLLIPILTSSRHFHFNANVVIFCIALPLVILLATLINRYIEIPAMQYLRKRK